MTKASISPLVESPTLEGLMDVFNVLSKPDAMTIFLLAKNGLEAETDAAAKIGLTRKQYYTRLKQLVDLELIERIEGKYYHTTLGSLIYNKNIAELSNTLAHKKELKIVDVLKKSSEFNMNEITRFLEKVSGERATLKCELIWSWNDMVNTLIDRIAYAEKEVLLISRFYEEKIIHAIINKGIDTKVIVDTDLVKGYIDSQVSNIKDLHHLDEKLKVISYPWYGNDKKIERRCTTVTCSMLIIDEKECAIELIDAINPKKFYACILIEDELVSKNVKYRFNTIWNIASNKEIEQYVENIKKEIYRKMASNSTS